jgi:zinc/manganese transport system ATP-binding protein
VNRSRRTAALIELKGASFRYGNRALWCGLDLTIDVGEFVAVLGPNGVGKTTLLRVLLGLNHLWAGQVIVLGGSPKRGDRRIGYIPQQRAFDASLPVRGRDLVRFGVDGHRWGPRSRRAEALVDAALAAVSAEDLAEAPVGLLSGGEQQRLRAAQALVSDPAVLLCDEPLLSLDPGHQRSVVDLLDERRRRGGTAVVFVTHDINPILGVVDRVLYLAPGSWAAGAADEILTSATLSRLYGTTVDVLRVRGRIVVVGAADEPDATLGEPGHSHLPAEPLRRG